MNITEALRVLTSERAEYFKYKFPTQGMTRQDHTYREREEKRVEDY